MSLEKYNGLVFQFVALNYLACDKNLPENKPGLETNKRKLKNGIRGNMASIL